MDVILCVYQIWPSLLNSKIRMSNFSIKVQFYRTLLQLYFTFYISDFIGIELTAARNKNKGLKAHCACTKNNIVCVKKFFLGKKST